ncbi:hypothetical protein BASA61_008472 [Batrachochytrium salamandrivorans]|nr:hypothetical protein BASA61_008472 [Batrachochytrium salamandrivorans]
MTSEASLSSGPDNADTDGLAPVVSTDVPNHRKPTVLDAASRITWKDLSIDSVLRLPCSVQSITTGIALSASVSIVRYITTRKIRTAANWGILSFTFTSLGSWEFCRFQRRIVARQMEALVIQQNQRDKSLSEKQQLEKELDAFKPKSKSFSLW